MPTAPILTATRTGLVDLLNPDPKTITLEAIAHGLSQINRWAGATEFPVSVAQHSILVMEIFLRLRPNLRPYAIYPLLHDAHEAFIGDWTEPAFRSFCEGVASEFKRSRFNPFDRDDVIAAMQAARARQQVKLDSDVRSALGIAPLWGTLSRPEEITMVIGKADHFARAIEWATFMPAANGPCPWPAPPFAMPRLKPLAPAVAAEKFTAAVERELALLRTRSTGAAA